MNNDINKELTKCYDEFQKMLLSNKYITIKDFDNFLDKYKDTLELVTKNFFELDDKIVQKGISILSNGYNVINKRNKKFINDKLKEYKDYFDNMFPNIVLSEEQRKAIIDDEDAEMIIAGSGSGKTTILVSKINYLVEKCDIDPTKIIVLTFNNKATQELNELIDKNIEILTFHEFGINLLSKRTDKSIKIIDKDDIYNCIVEYFKNNIFTNKDELKLFIETFKEYVNFNDRVYDFNNFDDYFKNYIDELYEKNKEYLSKYNEKRAITRLKNNKSIDGNIFRTKQEVLIANYLYCNGYEYQYNKLEQDNSYKPDFTVTINNTQFYIEYYSLTKLNKNNKYTVEDIKTYNNLMNKKNYLNENYKDLIELYYDYENNSNFIDILEKELNSRNYKSTPKTDKEIFYTLMNTSTDINFFKFIRLTTNFIESYKVNSYDLNYFDELIKNSDDNKTKSKLQFMKKIYIYYNKKIHKDNKIDINDVINYAYKEMDKIKEYFNYDYIIIDEFQDMDKQKLLLTNKICEAFNSKVVVIGDDWQSYNLEVENNFIELKGYGNINRITTCYRNNNINKYNITGNTEVVYYDNSIAYVLNKIIKKIDKNKSILLLGKNKTDINNIVSSSFFKKGPYNKIICNDFKNKNIEFLTINKSKGLEYDIVIVINNLNSIHNDLIIKILNPNNNQNDRRLFYIALTRAKEKVYILSTNKNEFIEDLINTNSIIENTNFISKN